MRQLNLFHYFISRLFVLSCLHSPCQQLLSLAFSRLPGVVRLSCAPSSIVYTYTCEARPVGLEVQARPSSDVVDLIAV